MSKKPTMVPIAELIEDYNLYPRNHVDRTHVGDIARAIRAGIPLPPIVADRESKRIVDGFHRKAAYRSVYGEEAAAPVEWRDYDSEADLWADAVALNAGHGRKFDRQDQIRITIIGERLRIPEARTAALLHVPEDRVHELRVRVVTVDGEERPAKRVAATMYGRAVTQRQGEAMKSFSGLPLLQHIAQLQQVIDAKLFDPADEQVLHALHQLAVLIVEVVPRPQEGAASDAAD
jgi:hypothetical protein